MNVALRFRLPCSFVRCWRSPILTLGFCLLSLQLWSADEGAPHRWAANTVILANASQATSLEVAEHYRKERGIPEENLVALPLPTESDLTREQFVQMLWNPLRRTLAERGLLLGKSSGETDLMGRERINPTGSRVRYLVPVMGVPYRIREMDGLDDASLFEAFLPGGQLAPQTFPMPLKKNQAAVDSELALLFYDAPPLTGFVPNPLFGKILEDREAPIVRVSRLDGPTVTEVLALVNNAIRAEAIGLRGRAYFDLAKRSGSYAVGDQWVERAAELARQAWFDVDVDDRGAVMPITARMDAPAIYFGWYTGHYAGVFRLPDFRFPPGAVAAHLHSSSASALRSPDRGWVGPFVAAGVTATVGNVFEPYLEQTHHFDLILEALLEGRNFGDAALAGLPSLSWQAIAIGDPLYEPFATHLESQLILRGDLSTAASDSYVALREINRLLAEGEAKQAHNVALRAFYKTPGPALALRLAAMEADAGETEKALRRLDFAPLIDEFEGQDWAVFRDIARLTAKLGRPDDATTICRHLLADKRLPEPWRLLLLDEGKEFALEAGDTTTSTEWRGEWNEIKVRREMREAEKKS